MFGNRFPKVRSDLWILEPEVHIRRLRYLSGLINLIFSMAPYLSDLQMQQGLLSTQHKVRMKHFT